MDDVKLALIELKEDSDSGRLQPAPAAAKRVWQMRLALGLAAIIVLVAAGLYWLDRQRVAEPEAVLTTVPLTSCSGEEYCPSFSNDGNSVAFEWCHGGLGISCDIYIKQIGIEPPSRLTNNPARDFSPAWSPNGRFIAFLRKRSSTRHALMLIAQRGGQERVVGESEAPLEDHDHPMSYLAWTPDSKRLVLPWAEPGNGGGGLFLISVETNEKQRLTDNNRDTCAAFSLDGRTLAFIRRRAMGSDVYLLHLADGYIPQGEPKQIASGSPSCYEVEWMPGGN